MVMLCSEQGYERRGDVKSSWAVTSALSRQVSFQMDRVLVYAT